MTARAWWRAAILWAAKGGGKWSDCGGSTVPIFSSYKKDEKVIKLFILPSWWTFLSSPYGYVQWPMFVDVSKRVIIIQTQDNHPPIGWPIKQIFVPLSMSHLPDQQLGKVTCWKFFIYSLSVFLSFFFNKFLFSSVDCFVEYPFLRHFFKKKSKKYSILQTGFVCLFGLHVKYT